ncbi:hypothetical protein [Hydrogenophaga sp.]|uniref:hypothetical protein n=1 Tax=Hydrogenophaga sp. TaxID=1904254 RepID=UPI0026118783|nr:hypothetical protein [Hydrogenophaga sp.]MCW5654802.1 hypothetical protein [Hydrogenophaga sp.]
MFDHHFHEDAAAHGHGADEGMTSLRPLGSSMNAPIWPSDLPTPATAGETSRPSFLASSASTESYAKSDEVRRVCVLTLYPIQYRSEVEISGS